MSIILQQNRIEIDAIRRDRAQLEDALRAAAGGILTFKGRSCRCPFHADKHPSASIGQKDGVWLFNCFVCQWGGDVFSVRAHARGVPVAEVLPKAGASPANRPVRRTVAEYDYRDQYNDLLFQVVRFDPKDFRQRRPDGIGGWIWNLDGIARVLYRLPELLNSAELRPDDPIFICEGEKDADNLWGRGLIATTNSGGAGSPTNNFNWLESYNAALFLRKIRVIPDADAVGLAHARAVAKSVIEYHQRAGQVPDLAIVDLLGVQHAA